ncbi:unnamed protein product [Soboliphyme baturini]|uniref:Secreted protein n=1 Tax=Soboliphyme baturini TaxID=241478 RepID=A0A183IML4_9BILA|nr:unnamed protein product [Soboliphyme baturini]
MINLSAMTPLHVFPDTFVSFLIMVETRLRLHAKGKTTERRTDCGQGVNDDDRNESDDHEDDYADVHHEIRVLQHKVRPMYTTGRKDATGGQDERGGE